VHGGWLHTARLLTYPSGGELLHIRLRSAKGNGVPLFPHRLLIWRAAQQAQSPLYLITEKDHHHFFLGCRR